MNKHVFTGISVVVASAIGLYFYQQQVNRVLQKEPSHIIFRESAKSSAPFNKKLLKRIATVANEGETNFTDKQKSVMSESASTDRQNVINAPVCCEDGSCEQCRSRYETTNSTFRDRMFVPKESDQRN